MLAEAARQAWIASPSSQSLRLLELVEVPPDILKFDISLVRDLEDRGSAKFQLLSTLNGLISAKAARMRCVAVPFPVWRDDPRFVLADYRVESLEEVDAKWVAGVCDGGIAAAKTPATAGGE